MKEWNTQFELDIPVDRYADLFISDRFDFHNRFHRTQNQVVHTQEKWAPISQELLCRPGPIPTAPPQSSTADECETIAVAPAPEVETGSESDTAADVVIDGDLVGSEESIAAAVESLVVSPPATAGNEELIDLKEFLLSPQLHGIKLEAHQWDKRCEYFYMPLPISAKFLKVAFGKRASQTGILIRNLHMRIKERLPDGTLIMESRACPIEKGFLFGRFFIHLVYRVSPHPRDSQGKCVVHMHGRISVKCPPITGAVEKFSLPFSKSKQDAWRKVMISYLDELAAAIRCGKQQSMENDSADIVTSEV